MFWGGICHRGGWRCVVPKLRSRFRCRSIARVAQRNQRENRLVPVVAFTSRPCNAVAAMLLLLLAAELYYSLSCRVLSCDVLLCRPSYLRRYLAINTRAALFTRYCLISVIIRSGRGPSTLSYFLLLSLPLNQALCFCFHFSLPVFLLMARGKTRTTVSEISNDKDEILGRRD